MSLLIPVSQAWIGPFKILTYAYGHRDDEESHPTCCSALVSRACAALALAGAVLATTPMDAAK